jgi:hypothetical protein
MPDRDRPGTYRLSDDPPPRRRYRKMAGAGTDQPISRYDESALRRFFGYDPFPWALAVCVFLWVALGFAASHWPPMGFVLMLCGFAVCIFSQLWLYLSIFEEDRTAGILSLLSGWYRLFYLYANPELVWRPALIAFIGLLMIVTGVWSGVSGFQDR